MFGGKMEIAWYLFYPWWNQWGFDTIWLCAPIRVWHTCNWCVLLAVHYIPDCPSTVISHRPTFHPQCQVKLCQPDVKCNKATPKGTRLHLRGNYSRQKTTAPILHCPVLSPDIVQLIGSTTVLVLYSNWHKRWRGLTEASEGYTLAWNSRRYISFHSLTLGVTLGCVAVSSLEAGPLVLARVGSETGAATFLDLKIQSTSISLVDQARAISPVPISPPPNFQRGREIGSAMLSIEIYLEIHPPHWLDVDWLEGMLISPTKSLASSMHRTYKSGREWYPKFC